MGIVSSQGSLQQTSNHKEESQIDIRLAPEKVTTLIDSNQYKLPTDGVHKTNHIYRNIVSNQTVYNVDRVLSDNRANQLLQYSDGHRVPVVYFSQVNPSLLGKTNPTDISTGETHNSHASYLKIIDFQLALDGPIEYSYNEDEGYMTATGNGTTLPGFIPKKGDIFYYLLNDGQWGIMVVRGVQRLSISTVTRHRVSFELQEYLVASRQDYIESQVTDTAYFDKMMYFNQPYTLLKHDAYMLFNKLLSMKDEMTLFYHDRYYNPIVSSFTAPGESGYYDPYLVEYLQNKFSILNLKRIRRPKQLYSRLEDYTSCIWSKLSGEAVDVSSTHIKFYYSLTRFTPTFWSSDVTSLAGRYYLQLEDEAVVPITSVSNKMYAELSYGFYTGDITSMDEYERIIYAVMVGEYSNVNPTLIYEEIKGYSKWGKKYAFYHIPIAMHLLEKALFILKD